MIDYSRPSRDKRLWVFDLKARKLLFEEWVTHGKNSGDDLATSFSNRPNSYQSSIGLFQTGQLYTGKHGQSLRLVGLEPGFNDKSEERAIVMHSAAYADPRVVPGLGRLGRSQGCPAVRPAVAARLINTLKRGSYLFAYYPQAEMAGNLAFPDPAELRRGSRGPHAGSDRQPAQVARRGGNAPLLENAAQGHPRAATRRIPSPPTPFQKRNRLAVPRACCLTDDHVVTDQSRTTSKKARVSARASAQAFPARPNSRIPMT
ncbi:Uncharacterised protein [Pseudomonas aeruginosa]|nr:Uncharacterised protein [Pseudomonas aeruginosa]